MVCMSSYFDQYLIPPSFHTHHSLGFPTFSWFIYSFLFYHLSLEFNYLHLRMFKKLLFKIMLNHGWFGFNSHKYCTLSGIKNSSIVSLNMIILKYEGLWCSVSKNNKQVMHKVIAIISRHCVHRNLQSN